MADSKRTGFCQVEPNHISGIITGQIQAMLPVNKTTMGDVIENGRFAKYDYANGEVNLTGAGEWMLIYNEEKLYDERKQAHKDFAMKASDMTDKEIVPRLISTVLGDVFTTNAIDAKVALTAAKISALTETTETTYVMPAEKASLYVGANGYLTATKPEGYAGPVFQVVKVYDLADGQDAVKVMRIQ